VRKACAVSENPLERRRLLNILVEDHRGYAFTPSILREADEVISRMLEERRTGGRILSFFSRHPAVDSGLDLLYRKSVHVRVPYAWCERISFLR